MKNEQPFFFEAPEFVNLVNEIYHSRRIAIIWCFRADDSFSLDSELIGKLSAYYDQAEQDKDQNKCSNIRALFWDVLGALAHMNHDLMILVFQVMLDKNFVDANHFKRNFLTWPHVDDSHQLKLLRMFRDFKEKDIDEKAKKKTAKKSAVS